MLSLFDPCENFGDLVSLSRLYKERNILADYFLRLVSENILCADVPRLNVAVQVFADDRIFGALNDSRQTALYFFRLLQRRYVGICAEPPEDQPAESFTGIMRVRKGRNTPSAPRRGNSISNGSPVASDSFHRSRTFGSTLGS